MKKENAHTIPNRERQAAYKERMRSSGYVQVTVWVKKERKQALLEYINDVVVDDL